jgi:hypothetical protein
MPQRSSTATPTASAPNWPFMCVFGTASAALRRASNVGLYGDALKALQRARSHAASARFRISPSTVRHGGHAESSSQRPCLVSSPRPSRDRQLGASDERGDGGGSIGASRIAAAAPRAWAHAAARAAPHLARRASVARASWRRARPTGSIRGRTCATCSIGSPRLPIATAPSCSRGGGRPPAPRRRHNPLHPTLPRSLRYPVSPSHSIPSAPRRSGFTGRFTRVRAHLPRPRMDRLRQGT